MPATVHKSEGDHRSHGNTLFKKKTKCGKVVDTDSAHLWWERVTCKECLATIKLDKAPVRYNRSWELYGRRN
jgi:hypothetical protein